MFNCGRQNRTYKQRILHEAIGSDDYLKVEELLTNSHCNDGLDVSKDQCALELAVSTGKSSIVQLLVQSGCCVNESNDVQFRALDMAIYKRFNDIVEILLTAGFDISVRNGFSESRLHIAACGDNDVILRRLLDQGFDADETTFSWTVCHVLAARNHLKTLKVLLRYGCNVDARNKDGATPILLALERNRLGPCFLLLQAGCELREVARKLKITADASADEESIHELLRSREASAPGNARPDQPPPQHAAALKKLSSLVRRRVYELPSSLKDLAKFAIRRAVRSDVERKVEQLPLPPSMRNVVVDVFGGASEANGVSEELVV